MNWPCADRNSNWLLCEIRAAQPTAFRLHRCNRACLQAATEQSAVFPRSPAFIKGASEAGKSSSRGAYDSRSARIFSQASASALLSRAKFAGRDVEKRRANCFARAAQRRQKHRLARFE